MTPQAAESSAPGPAPTVWPKGVAAFTLGYLLASVVGALATGNREFVFYIVVMVLLIAAIAAVHRRVGYSRLVLWGLSLWGLAHMAGGLLPVPDSWTINGEHRVLYSWWLIPNRLKYDHVVHAYGFGVTTLACWEGLVGILRRAGESHPEPTLGRLTLCAAAAVGFGALNEVVEFIATLVVPETNVGGYANTGWDLVSNVVGAVLAAVAIRILASHRKK
jgi:hypothetical protein